LTLDERIAQSTASSIDTDTATGTDLMSNADIVPTDAESLVRSAMRQMHLSARGYHRVLKVSRTIADLEGVDVIQTLHLAEALQYRTPALDL